MKSDFQRILDSYLMEPKDVETRPLQTKQVEAVQIHPSLLSEVQTRYFSQGVYQKEKMSSVRQKEHLYIQMKDEWMKECASEYLKDAIDCFYMYGARGFLTRKVQDIKRDYRKLALEYHPDRVQFQEKYTYQECHDIFQKIIASYKKLISSS